MALETTIRIRETDNGEPVDEYESLRRSYDRVLHTKLTVGKTRKPLPTVITDVQYVYVRCEGEGAVRMYRNLSPEALTFDTVLLLSGLEGCKRLSFEADSEVELDVYVAGS